MAFQSEILALEIITEVVAEFRLQQEIPELQVRLDVPMTEGGEKIQRGMSRKADFKGDIGNCAGIVKDVGSNPAFRPLGNGRSGRSLRDRRNCRRRKRPRRPLR